MIKASLLTLLFIGVFARTESALAATIYAQFEDEDTVTLSTTSGVYTTVGSIFTPASGYVIPLGEASTTARVTTSGVCAATAVKLILTTSPTGTTGQEFSYTAPSGAGTWDVEGANSNNPTVLLGSTTYYLRMTQLCNGSGTEVHTDIIGQLRGFITNDGTTPEPLPFEFDGTQLWNFNPELGSSGHATSTDFEFEAAYRVEPEDFATTTTQVYLRWRQATGMGLRGQPNVAIWGEHLWNIDAAGSGSVYATSSLPYTGVYTVYWEIRTPLFEFFGLSFLHKSVVSYLGSFVVGDDVSDTETSQIEVLLDTNQSGADLIIPAPTSDTATSTLESGLFNLPNIFNLKNVLVSRFPINWIVEYTDILRELPERTATTTIPTVTLTASSTLLGTYLSTTTPTFTFFSGATITQVAGIAGIQTMRTFVGWTLWFALFGLLGRMVSRMFKP